MAKRSDSWDLNEDDQRHQELSLEWGRLHQGLKNMRPEILANICDLSSHGWESLGAWAKRTNSRECEGRWGQNIRVTRWTLSNRHCSWGSLCILRVCVEGHRVSKTESHRLKWSNHLLAHYNAVLRWECHPAVSKSTCCLSMTFG